MVGQVITKQLYTVFDLREDIFAAGLFSFAVYLIVIFVKKLRGRESGLKEILAVFLLSAATGLILGMTLFSREYNPFGRNFELELLWSYKKAFVEHNIGLAAEIFCNIILFIPWGFLMPVAWKRFEDGRWLLSAALILSGSVELIQGILHLGLFEFDDILNNALGALIGWGLYKIVKAVVGSGKGKEGLTS